MLRMTVIPIVLRQVSLRLCRTNPVPSKVLILLGGRLRLLIKGDSHSSAVTTGQQSKLINSQRNAQCGLQSNDTSELMELGDLHIHVHTCCCAKHLS